MYPFKEKSHTYKDALGLKHDKKLAIAKEHNVKQTNINVTFDTVEDVADFNDAVFKSKGQEKVYKVEPNFLNPRQMDDLFTDYSENCVLISTSSPKQAYPYDHYTDTYPYHNEYDDDGDDIYYDADDSNTYGHMSYPREADYYEGDKEEEEEEEEDEEDYDETTRRNTMLNADLNTFTTQDSLMSEPLQPSLPLSLSQPVHPLMSHVTTNTNKRKKWMNPFKLLKNKVKKFQTNNASSSPQPTIQFIPTTEDDILGDALDSHQQKHLLNQLYQIQQQQQQQQTSPQQHIVSPERVKITSLDRIWVFRLVTFDEEQQTNDHIAWICFDYENQLLIEEYMSHPEEEGLTLYDSHIRHKGMPVVVIPTDNKGYYFADAQQAQLCTLEVKSIRNDRNNITFFQEALEKLPNEEQSSVLRFKFARDQHLTLGGLLLRRYYFSKHFNVPWSQLEFDRHPGGKPYLKHYDNIDFNISHEGYWVIFGCIKDMSIGVDVVVVDSLNNSLDEFIHFFESQLTIDEMSLIANSNYDKLSTFYEIWGCKESYIKAIGVGLALELDQLNFRNENDM
ncbi:hypothetical protein CU097_008725, partial [Rhizopus azygosporus]